MQLNSAKQTQGVFNHAAGHLAEDAVAEKYLRCGFEIVAKRNRMPSGEIDLIARHKHKFYFIEVKRARNLEIAALRITTKQQDRIRNAALEFLAQRNLPLETEMRFDAALVDHHGRMQVIPAAF